MIVATPGVWADDVRALDEGRPSRLDPPGEGHPHHGAVVVGNEIAAVIPVPKDRRSVFVVPWGGPGPHVGTTDTDYDGSLDDPQCTAADIDYLLAALNAWLTKPVGRHEVSAPGPACGRWSGRVGTSRRRRPRRGSGGIPPKDRAHRRPLPPPFGPGGAKQPLVTIVGGKLKPTGPWPRTVDEAIEVRTLNPIGRAASARRPACPPRAPARRSCSAPRATAS